MTLPSVLEIKRTLDGREKRFACRLLTGDDQHRRAVVLFVSEAAMHVHGVDLPPGTVTFGYFWSDRPYNAYHWMNPRGDTIGVYFNLSDRTHIAEGVLEWRDLAVDILTTPAGRVDVLDEEELPPDLPADVQRAITDGKAAILGGTAALLAEIEAESRALRPLGFSSAPT
ncbi:MAG TPA: DUF402 domain-containing protein [Polyangia bacterium]|nr:DUF402 domain-containing protein [Polyangia bacterium]